MEKLNLNEVFQNEQRDKLRKCFIDRDGNVYSTNTDLMHMHLANEICISNNWNEWKNYYDSAWLFLLHKKGFIKVANYDAGYDEYRYVSISANFKKDTEIMKTVEFVSVMLKVPIIYEIDPHNKDSKPNVDR